ncbi:hypothetical protein CEXT_633681 [Caerostris extrusa]|uniref:Uncharacterized protein n=1 Tax=Caerostris extrusa TaxID=172846 RepID=A0AAV4RFS2_CAEEX|nr:hypothetical protein CEXT_633681 [Caerostris extrusa]
MKRLKKLDLQAPFIDGLGQMVPNAPKGCSINVVCCLKSSPTTHESEHLFESLDKNTVLKSLQGVPGKSRRKREEWAILLCCSSCVIKDIVEPPGY